MTARRKPVRPRTVLPSGEEGSMHGWIPGVNIAVYARSSTDEQAHSCGQQIAAIEAYLRRGGCIDAEQRLPRRTTGEQGCFIDNGFSGWKLRPPERPGSAAMLDFFETHRRSRDNPGLLLIWSLSRLGRFPDGAMEAIYFIYALRQLGWWVRSLTEDGLDADGQARVATVISMALAAEKDTTHSETKSTDVLRGKAVGTIGGVWIGGSAPFGYDRWAARIDRGGEAGWRVREWLERLPTGKRNGNFGALTVLRPNEDAAWVTRIFRWYTGAEDGPRTQDGIAQELARLGVPTPTASSGRRRPDDAAAEWHWGSTTVHKILSNEVYRGVRTDSEGQEYPALWEPLVSADLWVEARQRLTLNATLRRGLGTPFVLSGLLACSACGEPYWGSDGTGAKGHWRSYRPKNRARGKPCGVCRKGIRAEEVEEPLLAAIEALAEDPFVVAAVEEEVAAVKGSTLDRRQTIADVETDIERKQEEINRLALIAARGQTVADAAAPALEMMQTELVALKSRLDGLRKRVPQTGRITGHVDAARRFRTVYNRATVADRKQLVRCFVSSIRIDGQCRKMWVAFKKPEGSSAT